MTRAGLDHHARIVAIVAHAVQHASAGMVQIEQNLTGILIPGIGMKIDVETFAVTNAQKSQVGFLQHPPAPHPFSLQRPASRWWIRRSR